jgi:replicative DNA helicase
MGKTTLALNIAEHAAIANQTPVAVFSMEMSREQLAFRMISSIGRVDQSHLRTGMFGDEDWARINSAIAQMRTAPIYIDDSGALTPTEVRARSRRLKRERGLGLIVIDYLQLMQVPGTKENRATEISEISRSLKALAKELKVPVVALSQLNRSVEQRVDKKPVMSDLRECVTGDTLVVLADGRRRPIRELVGTKAPCARGRPGSEGRRCRIGSGLVRRSETGPAPHACQRLEPCVRTGQHRVLTGKGWLTLDEISIGDRVALGRRLPVEPSGLSWSEHELILLGQLVGDGSYLENQPLRYTTASEENSAAVREAAEALGQPCHAVHGSRLVAPAADRWQRQSLASGRCGRLVEEARHLQPAVA